MICSFRLCKCFWCLIDRTESLYFRVFNRVLGFDFQVVVWCFDDYERVDRRFVSRLAPVSSRLVYFLSSPEFRRRRRRVSQVSGCCSRRGRRRNRRGASLCCCALKTKKNEPGIGRFRLAGKSPPASDSGEGAGVLRDPIGSGTTRFATRFRPGFDPKIPNLIFWFLFLNSYYLIISYKNRN